MRLSHHTGQGFPGARARRRARSGAALPTRLLTGPAIVATLPLATGCTGAAPAASGSFTEVAGIRQGFSGTADESRKQEG